VFEFYFVVLRFVDTPSPLRANASTPPSAIPRRLSPAPTRGLCKALRPNGSQRLHHFRYPKQTDHYRRKSDHEMDQHRGNELKAE